LYTIFFEKARSRSPAFTDTQAGTWYSNAVVWANERGILLGYGNNVFGINDPVSVEQLAVIVGRYTGSGPDWTGDPSKTMNATRAQVAESLYTKPLP